MGVDFSERYGLDKLIECTVADEIKQRGIHLGHYEIEKTDQIPFGNDYFDVVTMLAVFEHIEPERLVIIHREIYRVLKPGGIYVMTTPAFWTDRLLRFLARIGLISAVEINEHKGSYRFSDVSRVLRDASFQDNRLEHGYFEVFMNLWVTATK
jgi:2-polyprenyl-3-methyl-5-hydroxy-6-metoxy-1,4-benzoquinol methylase